MHKWEMRMLLKHYLERGVPKAALARRFGVNRRTIHEWIETGQSDRDLSTGGSRYMSRPPDEGPTRARRPAHESGARGPGPVLLVEPAVLQPFRVERLVLLPQQRQRHTLPSQLPVHLAPRRQRTRRAARRRSRKQSPFQPNVVDRLGYRPTQPRPLGTTQVIGHRRRRRPHAASNRPDAQRCGEVQPQHLSNLAHRQPPVRQCRPSCKSTKGLTSRRVVPRHSAPIQVIDLDRNH